MLPSEAYRRSVVVPPERTLTSGSGYVGSPTRRTPAPNRDRGGGVRVLIGEIRGVWPPDIRRAYGVPESAVLPMLPGGTTSSVELTGPAHPRRVDPVRPAVVCSGHHRVERRITDGYLSKIDARPDRHWPRNWTRGCRVRLVLGPRHSGRPGRPGLNQWQRRWRRHVGVRPFRQPGR